MDQQIIREVLTVTTQNLTETDKAVGARFNQIAMKALDRAEIYLAHGPETARLAITKSFLTAVARLSAADAEESLTVHRQAFLRTLSSMSEVEPHLSTLDTDAITVGTHPHDSNDSNP